MPMDHYFAVCAFEAYQERYLDFLLEHYAELNLPYDFPVALSFIGSPILLGAEAIVCFDGEDEPIAALGCIHGTGENDYRDAEIVQVQTVFIAERYRNTRLFLQGLQFLTQHLAQKERPVSEIRFWIPAQAKLQRLCAKLGQRTASVDTHRGTLEEYRTDFSSLYRYAMRFRHELYDGDSDRS